MRTSAGIVLHRLRPDADGAGSVREVLLGHMGGPYWARRDEGAWTIPKGEHGPADDPLAAACREFEEELGVSVPVAVDRLVDLGEVRQSSAKRLHCWAAEGDLDVSTVVSNTFEIEWPPRSGRTMSFPELDRAAWYPIATARHQVVRGQVEVLDRLARLLGISPAS